MLRRVANDFDVVAVRIDHEGRVVVGVVLRAQPGGPLSFAPASISARWNASTCARLAAWNAMWRGAGFSFDWKRMKETASSGRQSSGADLDVVEHGKSALSFLMGKIVERVCGRDHECNGRDVHRRSRERRQAL